MEAGATIPVDHALALMARAWKTGVEPSGVATASYVPQAAAPRSLRLDGSEPTGTSSVYRAPLAVSTTTTLRARGSSGGMVANLGAVEVHALTIGWDATGDLQATQFPPPPLCLHEPGGFRRTGEDRSGIREVWGAASRQALVTTTCAPSVSYEVSSTWVRLPPPPFD